MFSNRKESPKVRNTGHWMVEVGRHEKWECSILNPEDLLSKNCDYIPNTPPGTILPPIRLVWGHWKGTRQKER